MNQAILDAYRVSVNKSLVTFNTPPAWFTIPEAPPPRHDGIRFFHGKALAGNGTGVVLDGVAATRRAGLDARLVLFPSRGAIDAQPYDPDFSQRSREVEFERALVLLSGRTHRAMPEVMAAVDVGLIAYDRVLGAGSLPNRFFEYMAMGLPVIVPEYSPLMRDIVVAEGIGLTADFEDATSVAQAMQGIAADPAARRAMGERARKAFALRYAWGPIFAHLRERMASA